jgi:hypothetical protein
LNAKYQVTGWEITPFCDYRNDISSIKFLLLAKNQLRREDAWYAPRTDGGKKLYTAVCSVTMGSVWRNVLKPITRNLISKVNKLF